MNTLNSLDGMYQPHEIKQKGQLVMDTLHKSDKPFDIPGNFRAKQRRTRFDNSQMVFPKHTESASKNAKIYQTHYTQNFKKREDVRPNSPRPCSPTRRNNPHPSQNFLNWRIPTRVFDYGKERLANIKLMSTNHQDTHQRFYNDYTGIRRDPEHAGGVDPKILMQELGKSFGSGKERSAGVHALGKKRSERLNNKEVKLPTILRRSWSPQQTTRQTLGPHTVSPFANGKKKQADSKNTPFTPLFVKPEFEQFFRSWYDAVSPSQKEAVSEVMKNADDEYIQERLSQTLQPTAVEAIESWLASATEDERMIALGFIQALIMASEQEQNLPVNLEQVPISDQNDKPNPFAFLNNLPKPNNPPIARPRGARPMAAISKAGTEVDHHHNHHHHNHTSSHYKACSVCENQELEACMQALSANATMPMEVTAITELLNPLHPGVLAQKEAINNQLYSGGPVSNKRRVLNRPRVPNVTCVANRGSLFANTKQSQSKHFTIHPEWN